MGVLYLDELFPFFCLANVTNLMLNFCNHYDTCIQQYNIYYQKELYYEKDLGGHEAVLNYSLRIDVLS
jgi:hypothetical protein